MTAWASTDLAFVASVNGFDAATFSVRLFIL
jgi:hypothetical protein